MQLILLLQQQVGRRMSDLLRFVLVTWCWLFTYVAMAARTRSLRVSQDNHSDINLTTPELITKYGYPVERHSVQTEDGYILELHRIPHGKSKSEATVKPAVLVHHALLCSSFDWVVLGPEKSLGFILADAGYDVWLANARGNTYSRKHVTIKPSEPKFWEYSWHEMGTYDVPAEIDYILTETGQKKLFYVGHSMGTTMFFVMMSQRPQYNKKIRAMFAFAPVVFFTRTRNPVFHYLQYTIEALLERVLDKIGMHEFLPQNTILNPISIAVCKYSAFTQRCCIDFIFSIVGKSTQLDKKRLVVMLAHNPAGASTREVMHYAQEALSGEFRQFDFGVKKNMKTYGQKTPPRYNLSEVTTPVFMYYSDNDKLAPLYNVRKTFNVLPNIAGKFRVPLKTFNHLDFMWGKDANYLLYKDVLKTMKKYKGDFDEVATPT